MANSKHILVNSANGHSKEETDYKALLHKYVLSKWYLYILSGAFCIGLAYFYLRLVQPQYEISSKLLIRESNNNYGPEEDWLKRSLTFSAASENVRNEIQTLSSFWLMNSVVKDLNLDRRYFWKYNFSTIEAYHNFPIYVDSFALNPIEKSVFEITPVSDSTFRFSQDSEIGVYRFGELFTNEYGTFRIHKNGELAIESDSTLHVEFAGARAVTENYLNNMEVGLADNKGNSSILTLSMKEVVPQRGIDLLNTLVEQYNEFKAKEKTEITLNTLEFIDERLDDISSELQSLESSVENYKLSNDIASETTSDLDIVLQRVNDLTQEQKEIEVQISQLESMKRELKNDTSGDNFELISINNTALGTNNQIQELVKPYNDLVLERNQLLETGNSSNPVVKAANQKLTNLRSSIYSAIESMQNDLRIKQQSNESQYESAISRLRSVPGKERALVDKQRRQSITENLYTYLLEKKEETALALVSKYSNSLLIDPPHSSLRPVSPNKQVFYLGGVVGGLAIPFLFLLIIDLFRDSVQTEKELKKLIPGQTIMGIISHHKGRNRQVLLGENRDVVAERFRSLRTNLQFHYKEKTKCVLVTSSTCDEGKTFVATNLATSYALIRKKTIIIDFDLRKPDMIDAFNEEAEIGMSNYLTNDMMIEEIIQVSKTVPDLHYIASGPVLQNPVELLTEKKLDEFFAYLKDRYDIIIVDTPPVGIVSDAILLNKYVDHSLYVVRSGYTKKEMVENARNIFDQEKLSNPAIIFNGVKKADKGYGYSYKKYGYVQN